MNKKKKIALIIVSAILAVLIAGGSIAYAFFLPHPLNYDIDSIENIGSNLKVVSSTEDCVTIQKTGKENLRILMFTDLHLDGKNETSILTVSNLVDNIRREKPDLVLLGGDNVTSALNKKRANQFCQIFENLGVYWAGILGNHEGDNSFSVTRPEMISIFSSYEHCLMLEGPEDIWGDGNYYLNILNSDGTLDHTFIFMDTGDEADSETKALYGIPEEDDPYDGVKENQVEWYRSVIQANKDRYGLFQSTVVIHIPLPQMKEAAENGYFEYGGKLENVCASGFDSGLFGAIKEMESTKTVFCGHDHMNDFGIIIGGILLSYIQPSGYGSYTTKSKLGYEEKDWLQGYTMLNLSSDGTFEISRHKNSEKLN